MKKEDFYGKYLLRDGDLLPELIDEGLCRTRNYTLKFLEHLNEKFLIFDNREDAELASQNVRFIAQGVCRHAFIQEPGEKNDKACKPRVYLSGPISGHDKGNCVARFQRAEYELISRGYEVFNPMNNGLSFDSSTSQHMRRDLNELTREDKPYDAIYMMNNWNHSAGCWTEFKVALAIGLRVLSEQEGMIYTFV